MKGILIFNRLNDVLYSKCNRKFIKHVKKLAFQHGLIATKEDDVNQDVFVQIFSPLITSQRVLSCQFGNSYSFIQCNDGVNITFEEYMGFLFIQIGTDDESHLKRMLGVTITMVKRLCGPDVAMLKRNCSYASLLTRLLDTWNLLHESDQAVLVEAVEQLLINADLSNTTMKALQEAVEKIKHNTEYSKVHALILVENKFLSLYSSRNTTDLSGADILFLSLLSESYQFAPIDSRLADSTDSDGAADSSDEFYSPQQSPVSLSTTNLSHKIHSSEILPTDTENSKSHMCLLMGPNGDAYNPLAVHIVSLDPGVYLLLMLELGNSNISSGICEAIEALHLLQNIQLQKDTNGIKGAFENLEISIKKIFDGTKKFRSKKPLEFDNCIKTIQSKWEFIRKKYNEFLKSNEMDCVLRIESTCSSFIECLKELLHLTCLRREALHSTPEAIEAIGNHVKQRLTDYSEFLKVKALRNFTLGSRASLTINKYLEEFPGLVHFIYIDRTNHRVTAPCLDFSSEETLVLTKNKIWQMVTFSREHLQEGHLAVMCKDTTFSYSYFLWFEDFAGSPLKPKGLTSSALKDFPLPGILCGDFYKKLVELCFPKNKKVRCFELYCVHLGLATSSCVLEHTRRLAATIGDVTGAPIDPLTLI